MAVNSHHPRVIVIAGPNGAGKSTHADAIVEALGIRIFVNADYIARGLNGIQTDTVAFAAGRIMLRRLNELANARESFAFESTLSSRSFAPLANDWVVFDNSKLGQARLVARYKDHQLHVKESKVWMLINAAQKTP